VSSDARPLLAVDSSTEVAGIAVYDGSRTSELIWRASRNQTSSLMGEIERLLGLNGLELRDLGAVAVAIGPGGFNGLRVGLSLAKGLCYSLGLPIVGVHTLDAVAYPHAGARAPIRAFVPAGRQRVVFADYRYRNNRWVRLSDVRNERADALVDGIAERTVVVGEMSNEQADALTRHPQIVVPPPALRLRRPSYVAEVGFGRWQRGDIDRIETLEPVYVHGSSANERALGRT
jgi:tRNA threonylcarbamoyladenosine biosynthesis protein TsaB